MSVVLLSQLANVLPAVLGIVVVCVGGWVVTTWLRIKHGYPLESSWGRAYPPDNR